MLISEDLDEIIELADRIAVLYEGRVVGVVEAGTRRTTSTRADDGRGRGVRAAAGPAAGAAT